MRSKTFTFLLLFLFSAVALFSQEREVNKDGYYKGVIRIKLKEESVKKIEAKHEKTGKINQLTAEKGSHVKTNIAELDKKNEKFQAKSYKRVFRNAGKFEERHRAYGLHRWYEIEFESKQPLIEYLKGYNTVEGVEIAEGKPEMKLLDNDKEDKDSKSLSEEPNDPQFDDQWHYHNTGQTGGTEDADIDLPEALEKETGNTDVIVAIEDEGVDYEHEDLEGNMWVNPDETVNGEDSDNNGYVDDVHGYNFADDQGEINPGDHGTHVGGTVAAETNNETGVAGVAGGSGNNDGVRLMSVQVFSNTNGGFEEALTYSADMGAHVSQNSWGGGGESEAINDAIDYFNDNGGSADSPMDGGVVVFAAGNDDTNSGAGTWPAQYEGAIAVASTDHNDEKSSFSNYGEWVDISAPGSDILSCQPNDGYQDMDGTSMACPHVSGVTALIVSYYAGDITPSQVRTKLLENTDPIDDLNPDYEGQLGSGRLNADKALGDGGGDTEEPPEADFSANSTTIEEGETVDFTDQSSNYPEEWDWSFEGGDPSSSTDQNPSITYEEEGTYEVSLNVSNEYGSDSETKTNYITVEEYVATYCDSEGEDASYEWIDEITIGDFNNNSGGDDGYGDYTDQTVELAAGESYDIELIPGFSDSSYDEYWKIWIDFNDDKEFDESELVYDAGSTSSSEVTGTIDIPSDASGSTRMRVTMKYDGEPTACETFSYGEVEDYTVSFTDDGDDEDTEAPTTPTNLEADNVGETSLDLSWDESTDNVGVEQYTVYQDDEEIGTTENNSYNVSDLSAGTTYSFTVTAEDAAGNVSDHSDALEVTTDEEEEEPGEYCESKGEDASYEWIDEVQVGDFNNNSGEDNGYGDYTNQTVELTAGESYDITLTPGFSGSTYQEYWKIWIDFNGDHEFSSDELVYDAGSTSSSEKTGSIDIPSDASGSTRMRVTMKYNGEPTACETFSYGEVEDYTVSFTDDGGDDEDTEAPTAPANLTDNNVTENSADLSWDASSDNVGVEQYIVYQDGNEIGTTENTSYSVSDLNAGTTYSFTVTAEDAAGNVSEASNEIEVTTEQNEEVEYCESQGENTNYEWIDLVELGSINNSSGSDGGYADYTDMSTDLTAGSEATIYFSAGFESSSYTEYWHVWIDFNQNGTFEDDEEVVTGSSSSSDKLEKSFDVPSDASLGETRMRVTMKYNDEASPCESFSYGEVEDYTVNITNTQSYNTNDNTNATKLGNEKAEAQVGLYPNPASDVLKVNINAGERNTTMSIYNINGTLVKTVPLDGNYKEIDVSELPEGTYMIKIPDEREPIIEQFIKQ
ncbi:MAG: GEVED domain-containing protein [Bacteroidales bacterium]